MRKLQSLVLGLMKMGVPREKIKAFADKGYLIPVFRDLGNGYLIAVFKYDGVIDLENFNLSPFELLAWLNCWLAENDKNREALELTSPEINATLNDDWTSDVEITVEFEEDVQIVPDENGPIPYLGRNWKVADVPIDVATDLENMEGESDVK